MSRPQLSLQLLGAAGLLLVAGCAPASSSSSIGVSGVQNAQSGAAGGPPAVGAPTLHAKRLLERMQASPEKTRYAGVRRIELRFEDAGVPQVLEYREEAACDGDGKFALEVLDVLNGVDDEDLFRSLQNSRQVFTFNYRDFRITDRNLFRDNYRLRVLSESATIAGVPCLELRIDRTIPGGRCYVVHVEPETGFVLRWEQRSADGELLGTMEFESIAFDPDLSNYLLMERNFEGQEVDIDDELGTQVGFGVLTPHLLPTGYRLESARIVVGALQRTWIKRVYTDGVGRLALLHREHEPLSGPSDERHLGQVLSMQVGPWNVVSGSLDGWSLILMGQVDPDELYQTLQSAF